MKLTGEGGERMEKKTKLGKMAFVCPMCDEKVRWGLNHYKARIHLQIHIVELLMEARAR